MYLAARSMEILKSEVDCRNLNTVNLIDGAVRCKSDGTSVCYAVAVSPQLLLGTYY